MKQFITNNLSTILSLSLFIISLLVNIINNIKIRKKSRNEKDKLLATEALKEDLKKSINNFIVDAEKLTRYSGIERKAYVMTRAISIANGLMSPEEIDQYVEEQVLLTDLVNKHT